MDPLSITASTITVIQSLISAYEVLQHIKGLPKAFTEVGRSLPLVKETLELAHEVLDTDNPDESVKKAIRPALRDCKKRANTIKDIFDEIEQGKKQEKDAKDWTVFVRFYRRKIAPLGKAHKVETLMQEILNKLKVLAIHQIFKAHAESQGQIERLETAIKALSEVEPSLPDSDFDGNATNYTLNNSDNARGFISTGSNAEISMGDRFSASGDMNFEYHVYQSATSRRNAESSVSDWLKYISRPLHFEKVQLEMLQMAQKTPGAGQWFLSSSKFRKWRDGDSRKLWCHGIPGTGKTVLASIIIDHLRTRFSCNDKIAYVYVYFDYKKHQDHSPLNIFVSLLTQLLQWRSPVSATIRELHNTWKTTRQNPSDRDCLEMLKSQTAAFGSIFMVVDALDECLDDDKTNTLNNFLGACQELPHNVHMLFTSRQVSKYVDLIQPDEEIEIVANNNDIKAYVDRFIESRPHLHRVVEKGCRAKPSFRDDALTTIVERSQGMFLLAHLHIESLASAHDLAGFTSNLKRLSTNPNEVYMATLQRIEGQTEARRDLAFRVLTWLLFALRPLAIEELTQALAIQNEAASLQYRTQSLPKASETFGGEEALTSVCAGIVVVVLVGNQKIVRLAHATAEDYLRSRQPEFLHNAQSMMAETCLCCLKLMPIPSSPQVESTWKIDYPFFVYAANYWGSHLSMSLGAKGDLYKLAWAFISDKSRLNESVRAIGDPLVSYEANVSALHMAAYFGLIKLVKKAIGNNKHLDINAQTKRAETPLHWAAAHGKREFMELLIKEGADINVANVDKKTALHRAIMAEDKAAIKMLLSSGRVNLDLQDAEGYTCLRWATKYGQLKTVDMLLKARADVNACDKDGYTALRWAAHEGYRKIVKTLVRHGASVESSSPDKWTLLRWAAQEGKEDIIKFLSKRKIDLNTTDADGWTALRWAVDYNRAMAAWLLIQARADVNKPDHKGVQPLHTVAEKCCNSNTDTSKSGLQILWLLLENRADANAKIKHHSQTPLHIAASGGSNQAVWLLLQNGADPRLIDSNKRTALHCAIGNEHVEVSQTLIRQAGDLVHAVDRERWTALHYAASLGNPLIAEMLLDHGANIDVQDSKGNTALHLAVSLQHDKVAECLVRRGANLQLRNGRRLTAIEAANSLGNETIISTFRQVTGAKEEVAHVESATAEPTTQRKWDRRYAATVEDE